MCLNAHRFRHRGGEPPRSLTLCGPPGSGKTTLADLLAVGHPGWAIYREDFPENHYLGDLQDAGAAFNADASQSWFLGQVTNFFAV